MWRKIAALPGARTAAAARATVETRTSTSSGETTSERPRRSLRP